MNTNDAALFAKQATDAALKPIYGVMSHLVAGVIVGGVLAIVVNIMLQTMKVSPRKAGQWAGAVLILCVAGSLVILLLKMR